MRARQRDREGERGLFRCQGATDGAVELANLLSIKSNLGGGDNRTTHTHTHTPTVMVECKPFPPPGFGLLQTFTCAIPFPTVVTCTHTHAHTNVLPVCLLHHTLGILGSHPKTVSIREGGLCSAENQRYSTHTNTHTNAHTHMVNPLSPKMRLNN